MTQLFPAYPSAQLFPASNPAQVFPTAFALPTADGTKSVFVEIDLESGVRKFSQEGVSTRNGMYEARLLSISSLVREVSYGDGFPRASECNITLANQDREWQTTVVNESIINRRVTVRVQPLDDAINIPFRIFTGKITDFEIGNGQITLQCTDSHFDIFNQPLSSSLKLLDTVTFPDMPPGAIYAGKLVPIIYGEDFSSITGVNGEYAMPAYLIDPALSQANYRYVLCQHTIVTQAVNNTHVRRYGITGNSWVGTAPSLTTATYGGVLMMVLDFASDQRDAARNTELEITHNFDGMNPSGPLQQIEPDGDAIVNPVTQLHHFLRNYVPGISASDFDYSGNATATSRSTGNSSILEAETSATTFTEGAVFISGDPGQTFAEIIANYSRSFPMGMYITRGGLFGMYYLTQGGSRDSSINQDAPLRGYADITEDADILAGSYNCRLAVARAVSDITHQDHYNWVNEVYTENTTTTDSNFRKYVAGPRYKIIQAPYAQSTIGSLVSTAFALNSPLNRNHVMRVPLARYWDLELDRLINITHREIPASYRTESMRLSPSLYLRLHNSAIDSSVNALTGSALGGVTWGEPGALHGDSNTSAMFNGTTGYISVPDTAVLDPGNTFSIECWIKLASTPSPLFMLVDKGANGYAIVIDATPLAYLQKSGVGNIVTHSSQLLRIGAWEHILVTKAATDFHIYINGVERTDTSLYGDQTIVGTASALEIGRASGGGSYFHGQIDEFKLYSTALTAAHARILYLSGLAKYSPTVVARIIGLELNLSPSDMSILVRAIEMRQSL